MQGLTIALYQTVPNTEQMKCRGWRGGQNKPPELKTDLPLPISLLILEANSLCSRHITQLEKKNNQNVFSFLLPHLLFLALMSLVRYVHGIPKCMCV